MSCGMHYGVTHLCCHRVSLLPECLEQSRQAARQFVGEWLRYCLLSTVTVVTPSCDAVVSSDGVFSVKCDSLLLILLMTIHA